MFSSSSKYGDSMQRRILLHLPTTRNKPKSDGARTRLTSAKVFESMIAEIGGGEYHDGVTKESVRRLLDALSQQEDAQAKPAGRDQS